MILLRHGQTLWNLHFGQTRIDPGLPDPGLTQEGRRQAAAAAEALAGRGISLLFASPYRRTLETAAAVAERLDVPIFVEPLLRERAGFSCDIGTRAGMLAEAWPALDFSALDERWWCDLGESDEEVLARARAFRAAIAERPDRDRICAVTHWGVVRALTGETVENGAIREHDPSGALSPATPAC